MPRLTAGPLQNFFAPDYGGGCITNLLASVIRHLGGSSPHAGLDNVGACLDGASRVGYLVVDGLGAQQLRRYLARGGGRHFFGVHPFREITTVFPATTAAAVTTFLTGASPAEHGILGWHLHLSDLGLVSTVLLGLTRTGVPYAPRAFDLRAYLALPSRLASVPAPRLLVSPWRIARSRFSRAAGCWTGVQPFVTLRGLGRRLAAFARRKQFDHGLAYAYWPAYDSACHRWGCDHPLADRALDAVDRVLGRVVSRLRGTGTVLLVLGDHGLVDAGPAEQHDLADVPGFYETLAVLPSGDARQVHCFVRPATERRFLELVRRHLDDACVCLPAHETFSMGLWGPGPEHPALRRRVGDYVLIARDGHALASSVPGRPRETHVAHHGGLSEAEVVVPLYAVRGAEVS